MARPYDQRLSSITRIANLENPMGERKKGALRVVFDRTPFRCRDDVLGVQNYRKSQGDGGSVRSSTAKKSLQQQVAAFSGIRKAAEWLADTDFQRTQHGGDGIVTRK
jgi:hypothetical protein